MNKHLHSLQALLLAGLMLMAGNALAQKPYSYSPSGPVTIKTGYGGQKTAYLSITNLTHNPLKMWVNFYTDSTLKFSYAQWSPFTIGGDSTSAFPVTYKAWAGDTSMGWMVISDSLTLDTIVFIGIDTGTNTQHDWSVRDHNLYLGTQYQHPDSGYVMIRNEDSDSLNVAISLLSGGTELTFDGGNYRTVPGNDSIAVLVHFRSAQFNSAQNTLRVSGAGTYRDVYIYAAKYLPPHDSLYWQWQYNYDTVSAGDTVCQTITILNAFDSTAYIHSFTLPNNSDFFISSAPPLPYAILGHDTLVITVCYAAPNSSDHTSNGYIMVDYTFAGDSNRSGQIVLHGSTKVCYGIYPSFVNFGGVERDSSRLAAVYVKNFSNSTITLDADFDQAGASHFDIVTSLPLNIAPHDSEVVQLRFNAIGANQQYAKLIFDAGTGCGTFDVGLSAWISDSNIVIDSNDIGLFADQTSTLQFFGDSSHTSVTYRFYNDQSDSIKVNSVTLRQHQHFSITDIAPHNPIFKLGPSGIMEVTVEFDGTPGTYEDTLDIVTESGFIALSFPIHAVISGSAVTKPTVSSASMVVTPNPSSGPIAITLRDAKTARIEVLDVMGKEITQFEATSANVDRTMLAAGTYFVRASGVGLDGKPFVITTRAVLK